MTQTFKCPNCGGPLEYEETGELTVRCPFCSNTVIVPEELRPAKKPAENQPSKSAPPTEKPAETSTGLATLLGQLMSNRRAAREERRAIRRQWRINRRS